MSERSFGFATPSQVIALPGTIFNGVARRRSSVLTFETMPDFFMAVE